MALLAVACGPPRYPGPLEPDDALKSFSLVKGFRIEPFAAEPHLRDPVEMVFDEYGTAFVVEMPDYPFKPVSGKGQGSISALSDTDGDGRIDKSVVFADALTEATSILPWKGGLLVTAAPYILYLKDTNADHVADTREVLFSGFFENNSEAQITSLRFGVDNWIYAANNGQTGEVTYHRKPELPALSVGGADFRFRLDRDTFEREAGNAQFGHTMDDWGNRFITQNTLHIRHVVIPGRYVGRTRSLTPNASILNISDHDPGMFQQTPPPYWRAERTARRQREYAERNLDRVEYAEDHFTGCSGGTFYDGDAFPETYYGSIFTGDVAGNLVHRDVLVPLDDRPTFVAQRGDVEKNVEFLSSADPWFRPTSFTVGPDGDLYVIDMYRQHIETPLSIPEDLKADMDFLNGTDRGRIYRITPEHTGALPQPGKMPGKMSIAELVATLAHSNRWWRQQAQRLLLEKQDKSAVPMLLELFSAHESPTARLRALYALEGLESLNASVLVKAMEDPHPGVRKHGIILSEQYPGLLSSLIRKVDDVSVDVVFQAALSIGGFSGEDVVRSLAKILKARGEDPLFCAAVLTARVAASHAFLEEVVSDEAFLATPAARRYLEESSFSLGAAHPPEEINAYLDVLSSPVMNRHPELQTAAVKGIVKGLLASGTINPRAKERLEHVDDANLPSVRERIQKLKAVNTGANFH